LIERASETIGRAPLGPSRFRLDIVSDPLLYSLRMINLVVHSSAAERRSPLSFGGDAGSLLSHV
jgi:hypothetical protein